MNRGLRGAMIVLCCQLFSAPEPAELRLTDYVNTLRGTGSTSSYSRGNTIPAVTLPFGFNFWTPITDANSTSWMYQYDKPAIQAFAISHLPSPWLGDWAQLQIMPMVQSLRLDPSARADAFTHAEELARAHYYRVHLRGSGIVVEITPSEHGAMLRFTFPQAESAHVLFDTVDAATGQIHVDRAADVISGYLDQRIRMYFYATIDTPITQVTDPEGGGLNTAITFGTSQAEVVSLRIATSFISVNQARTNLETELVGRSFDQLKEQAQSAWDRWLGRIEIEGATEHQKWTFYSNMYRAGMYPNSMTESVAGKPRYRSPFVEAERDGNFYTNNGFWDTFRAAWPLYTWLVPEQTGAMLQGFVAAYQDAGWVPRWSGPGALDCMVGSHSDAIFGDAYLKNVRNFDIKPAYESMLKNALVYSGDPRWGRKGNGRSIFRGFIPLEDVPESAAWYLEDTTNDFVISRVAEALGDDVHARYFRGRALRYANLFSNSVGGFFRGRRADGSFRTPDAAFKPQEWGHEFVEGCPWHYIAAATHDPRGMANLYGGQGAFEAKLDAMFSADPQFLAGSYKDVIHEMREAFDTGMGQYAHANEPVHSTIYMYDYVGAPSKAQRRVREVLDTQYGPGLHDGAGYLGDEDNGQMSAWYIFSALGFYPAAAGQAQYAIGSPLFSRATVHLENGSDFVVVARGNSSENRYIQRARLNGAELERAYLEHAEVAAGGVLEFDMGPSPSSWGARPATPARSATTTDQVPVPLEDRARAGSASASAGVALAAFDDDSATKWTTTGDRGYLQYQFADAQAPGVSLYTLTSADDQPQSDPMDWTLSGSQDGENWVAIDERRGETFSWRRQTRVFAIANAKAYRSYRLTLERNHGASSTQLAEFELLVDGANP